VTFGLLAIIALIGLDSQNVLAWWRGWTLAAASHSSDDYTIIVPVYGHRRYFEDRSRLEHLKERCLIAVDVAGEGCIALIHELRDAGWRVFPTSIENPGPPKLVEVALSAVTTKYAARLDADSEPLEDMGSYVARMGDEGVQLASVRVVPRKAAAFVVRLQGLEYRMAMLSRRFRPWLTSGACFVGETESLKTVLGLHTKWFPGEDLETGRIALALRMKVRHLDLRIATDAPSAWGALFKQRRSWWAGGFRHAVINADKNLRHTPLWTLYYSGLVVAGIVVKAFRIAPAKPWPSLALAFALLYLLYVVITFAANWQVRSPLMFLYPPYAIWQAIGMPTAGLVWYVIYARRNNSFGRYRFGYKRAPRPAISLT
jgi:cellulose synthase/poly-beta-1,6-N-acetylglucosamine synthase-like glycosyltransferase